MKRYVRYLTLGIQRSLEKKCKPENSDVKRVLKRQILSVKNKVSCKG